MTPLMHAAYSGRYELCEYLIEKGADVNSNSHSEGVRECVCACACMCVCVC